MVYGNKPNNRVIKAAPFWQHEWNQGLVEMHEATGAGSSTKATSGKPCHLVQL